MNAKKDRYYLAPYDQDTNKSLGMGKFEGEVHLELLCPDGLVREGYEVTLAFVQNAFRSRKQGALLVFTAFKQEDDNKPVVLSANEALGHKPKGQQDPAVKQMTAGLKKVMENRSART